MKESIVTPESKIKNTYKTPELTKMGSIVDNTMGGGSGTNDQNGPQTEKPPPG